MLLEGPQQVHDFTSVYLHSDKTQEQSNKSSMMKNNDNKLNREKQMSRLDCSRGERRRRTKKWREDIKRGREGGEVGNKW